MASAVSGFVFHIFHIQCIFYLCELKILKNKSLPFVVIGGVPSMSLSLTGGGSDTVFNRKGVNRKTKYRHAIYTAFPKSYI